MDIGTSLIYKSTCTIARRETDWSPLQRFMKLNDAMNFMKQYYGTVSSKINLVILFQIFQEKQMKVTLALKCMANDKFSAL